LSGERGGERELMAPFRPHDHPLLSLTADAFIHAIG
jgi:hypothetical protein